MQLPLPFRGGGSRLFRVPGPPDGTAYEDLKGGQEEDRRMKENEKTSENERR